METIYRIICALCIISLQFPLYYLAPVNSISYTDVMNNDTNLCNNPIKQFLSKSEYTKQCATLSYPRDIDKLTLEYKTMETFLCLGMHDAIYKVCQYATNKKWTNKFNKTEDLDLYIQNITGFKSSGEASFQNSTANEKKFCEVLSGYTPAYEKVQPALLKLAKSLKDPYECNKICIDLDHKLNPLCAVLAWINQIDQTITSNTTATKNSELPIQHEGKNKILDTNHYNVADDVVDLVSSKKEAKNYTINIVNQTVQDQNLQHNTLKSLISSTSNLINDGSNEGSPVVEKSHVKKGNITKSQSNSPKTTLQADVSKLEKLLDEPELNSQDNNQQHDNAMTDAHQLPKSVVPKVVVDGNKKSSTDKNVNNKTTSPQIEEIKSTTLSENTQDNAVEDNAANNPNPEDFSRVDDDHLSNSLMDSLAQPMDADDQNMENSPKEMENIRVMKNDEESHFFTYFVITSLGFIGGYIAYHNKQKILAIVLEGRRSKNNRGRRRPSTANYRKLDCTLEEAVTSQCNANVTHVIY